MSESGGGSGEVVQPNLTPILDMVFQLITFFMLVINFKSAELDDTLKLPVLGSARAVNNDSTRALVLNIRHDKNHPKGCLYVYGQEKPNIEKYLTDESVVERRDNHMTENDIHEGGKVLPTLIVLRCDRDTPFHIVNRVIRSCQENGFRNFALMAHGAGK
jgi:biopolymer transport protein ExbD